MAVQRVARRDAADLKRYFVQRGVANPEIVPPQAVVQRYGAPDYEQWAAEVEVVWARSPYEALTFDAPYLADAQPKGYPDACPGAGDSIILVREPQTIEGVETVVANMHGCEHVVRHSPTGIEWGYGGSGPADCARSILIHFAGTELADRLYQRFKAEVIALVPEEGAELSKAEILKWLAARLELVPEAELPDLIRDHAQHLGQRWRALSVPQQLAWLSNAVWRRRCPVTAADVLSERVTPDHALAFVLAEGMVGSDDAQPGNGWVMVRLRRPEATVECEFVLFNTGDPDGPASIAKACNKLGALDHDRWPHMILQLMKERSQ